MKSSFLTITLLVILAAIPFISTADNGTEEELCGTEIMFCDNDHSYTVFVCDDYDRMIWDQLLCGMSEE